MSTVLPSGNGYEFALLSTAGMRLVNEFQRVHPELCLPSSEPSYRYIRRGSPEQNVLLEKLAAEVRARDPVITPPKFILRR
jgi:hypothetical protein